MTAAVRDCSRSVSPWSHPYAAPSPSLTGRSEVETRELVRMETAWPGRTGQRHPCQWSDKVVCHCLVHSVVPIQENPELGSG